MLASPTEQLDRASLRSFQLEHLRQQVKWAGEKSSFYKERFAAAGVTWQDIETLDDIRKLPFLTISDLHQAQAAMDIVTLPLSGMLRYSHFQLEADEITHLYTPGDVAADVEMMRRALVAAGVTRASTLGVMGDMADSRLLDVQYAAEQLGAMVIPFGTSEKQQLWYMEHVSIDVLIGTAQHIMQLIIHMQAMGHDIASCPLAKIICLNSNGIQNPLQSHIKTRTRTEVYSLYASAELGLAGVLYPCEAHSGQHVQEDFYYPEIISFQGNEPIEEADVMGELVVTTLQAEAMPMIRYRTGQAVSLSEDQCSCGRTLRRVVTPFSFM